MSIYLVIGISEISNAYYHVAYEAIDFQDAENLFLGDHEKSDVKQIIKIHK